MYHNIGTNKRLCFSDDLDSSGEFELCMEIETDGDYSEISTWLTKEDAIILIDKLKSVFEIN